MPKGYSQTWVRVEEDLFLFFFIFFIIHYSNDLTKDRARVLATIPPGRVLSTFSSPSLSLALGPGPLDDDD